MDDVSQVRDLSVGGLFVATDKARQEGAKVKIEFLVQEGQIRTEAVVRRWERVGGLGLKFTAISRQDRHRLAALLARMRSHANETTRNTVVQSARRLLDAGSPHP